MDLGRLIALAALALLAWVGWSQLHEDDTLRPTADEMACLGRQCTVALTKKQRDLFGYTFTYRTYAEQNRVVSVTCARSLWIFGSYSCDVTANDSAGENRYEGRQ